MKTVVTLTLALGLLLLAACSTAGQIQVSGQFQDCRTSGSPTQVTVEDSSHNVIGTASLNATGSAALPTFMGSFSETDYKFRMALPQESRYGFHIEGVPGTIWLTPTQVQHAALSAGC